VGGFPRSDQESGRRTMDVTAVAWRTSSYSGDNGGACIEVGTTGPAIAVRDSKHPNGLQLAFTPDTWKTFTDQLKTAP
jgi:Domain of unknown function (DUF397)